MYSRASRQACPTRVLNIRRTLPITLKRVKNLRVAQKLQKNRALSTPDDPRFANSFFSMTSLVACARLLLTVVSRLKKKGLRNIPCNRWVYRGCLIHAVGYPMEGNVHYFIERQARCRVEISAEMSKSAIHLPFSGKKPLEKGACQFFRLSTQLLHWTL